MKSIELLKEAKEILDRYWFSDLGQTNNDDVINMCEKIKEFLGSEKMSKLNGSHQELIEQLMLLVPAVLRDQGEDIQDFKDWAIDYYGENHEGEIELDLAIHRIRGMLEDIRKNIRDSIMR